MKNIYLKPNTEFMSFSTGDILKGKDTNHPIIFLKKENTDFFYGCIITHSNSKRYPINIPMEIQHFEVSNETGQKYEIQFERTHIVKLELIKKNEWGPFKVKGKLTSEGIQFVENQLKNLEPTTWKKYIASK